MKERKTMTTTSANMSHVHTLYESVTHKKKGHLFSYTSLLVASLSLSLSLSVFLHLCSVQYG